MYATPQLGPPPVPRTFVIRSLEDAVTVAAESRLLKSRYSEVRRLSCEFHEGVLTLRGRVSCYHMKQIAQHVVDGLSSVREIENRLNVRPPVGQA